MEKSFIREGNLIKLEGITTNPKLFCQIKIDEFLAGKRVFPCSIGNISYKLSHEESHIAALIAHEVFIPQTHTVCVAQ